MIIRDISTNFNNQFEIDKISNESIMIWVKESQEISKQIYDDAILNSNLGYNYRYKYLNTVI